MIHVPSYKVYVKPVGENEFFAFTWRGSNFTKEKEMAKQNLEEFRGQKFESCTFKEIKQ